MTPDRFAKVREFFDVVVDLPLADRERAMRAETDDQAIIDEVLALCRSTDKGSTTQFSRPLNAMLKGATAPKLHAGDMLGVWKIDREIGQGGMGSVFLVERSDGHFTQTAALKFVKGLPRTDTLAYFSRERQLLATLTHPNIARLLDGGATEDGQPYLVMEYVDGVAIDEFCRQRKLDTAQILKLFSTACDAVAFAHRQLIVHCDLKPSNLMINRDGRPVLLDFGIARLIDRVGAQANDAAIGSSVAYTPRYASPEQREHGIVSTVSDIYSLGIMLGELLGKDISPELVAILAKATAHDPANRYATVDALTSDIERFLKKMPLAAMPATPGYVSGKFLQRRWPMVLIGAAFAATVVGFTIRVLNESQRAQSAEKVALSERDRAQVAEQQAVKERDATQAARAEAVQERDGAARERDRATDAEQIAAAQRTLARVAERQALSERDRAKTAERQAVEEKDRATQAEHAARETSDFLVSIFDSSNPNAESGDVPASRLIALAESRLEKELTGQSGTRAEVYGALAQVQANMGQSKASMANYRRALAIERTRDRPLPLAKLLIRMANLDMAIFEGKESQAWAREALELRRGHTPADSEEVAEALAMTGYIETYRGDTARAAEPLQQALAMREKRDPRSAGTAQSINYLAQWHARERRYDQAIPLYQRAMAMQAAIGGEGHPNTLAIAEDLAQSFRRGRRFEEAEVVTRMLMTQREKLHGRANQHTIRAIVLHAQVMGSRGKSRDAISLYQEAMAGAEKLMGRDSVMHAVIENNIANMQRQMGLNEAALTSFKNSARGMRAGGDTRSPGAFTIERNVGTLLRVTGRYAEAHAHMDKLYVETFARFGEKHTETQIVLMERGFDAAHLGRFAEARTDLDLVQTRSESLGAPLPTDYFAARARLAEGEARMDEAGEWLMRGEAEWEKRGIRDIESWIFKVSRAELMARRGDVRAKVLARDILLQVEFALDANAPVLGRLREIAGAK